MSNSAILKSSLSKKYWMAATGLFLCIFLIGHLAGNLQLLMSGEEAQLQFNAYAKFMTTNPLVKLLSYVTYISIIFHAVDGIALTVSNRKARPVGYAHSKPAASSSWNSRNMGVLGTILLIFIIIHMRTFWYEMHWGEVGVDADGNRDLHTIVMETFTNASYGLIYTIAYVLAMVAMGFHLMHGVKSGFASLGLRTKKTGGIIEKASYGFALIISLLFAIIPVYIYITH